MYSCFLHAQSSLIINSSEKKYTETRIISTPKNIVLTEVRVTFKDNNVTLPSFFYSYVSDNCDSDVIKDFEKDPRTISGTQTIQVDGEIVYRRRVVNGELQATELIDFQGTSELGKQYPCSIRGQIKCVDDRIKEMNWVDYGACLITAPVCYAQLHASCLVDNCNIK